MRSLARCVIRPHWMTMLAALSLACVDLGTAPASPAEQPQSPAPPTVPPPKPPLQPTPPFPSTTDADVIYVGPDYLYEGLFGGHVQLLSRFVFFSDSSFELQFSSYAHGLFAYPGRFARRDSVLTLAFDHYRDDEPTTAILRNDQLDVRYGWRMKWSDFFDGVYVRQR